MHLKNDRPTSDLLFCIHKRRYLNVLVSGQQSDWIENLPFPNFSELSGEWKDRSEFIADSIQNLWFEIDEEDLKSGRCDSSFFFAPQEGLGPLGLVDITNEVYRRPTYTPGFKNSLKTLFQVADFISGQAEVIQIGQMRSRGESGFRLFIQGVQRDLMQGILSKFKKDEHNHQKLWQLWGDIDQYGGRAEINIDIGERLGEKIGLESYFPTWEKARGFLNAQVAQGRASKLAARALVEDVEGFRNVKGRLKPFFSHFKVNYLPSEAQYLKAYIAFNDIRNTPLVTRTHH